MAESSPPPDPIFAPDEKLYRGLRPDWVVEVDGEPRPAFGAIQFPAFSVNRSKYSEPEQMLSPPKFTRVGLFRVSDLPAKRAFGEAEFEFIVEHVPENGNYAHSEVRLYRDGRLFDKKKLKRNDVKEAFRGHLLSRMTVL